MCRCMFKLRETGTASLDRANVGDGEGICSVVGVIIGAGTALAPMVYR